MNFKTVKKWLTEKEYHVIYSLQETYVQTAKYRIKILPLKYSNWKMVHQWKMCTAFVDDLSLIPSTYNWEAHNHLQSQLPDI